MQSSNFFLRKQTIKLNGPKGICVVYFDQLRVLRTPPPLKAGQNTIFHWFFLLLKTFNSDFTAQIKKKTLKMNKKTVFFLFLSTLQSLSTFDFWLEITEIGLKRRKKVKNRWNAQQIWKGIIFVCTNMHQLNQFLLNYNSLISSSMENLDKLLTSSFVVLLNHKEK